MVENSVLGKLIVIQLPGLSWNCKTENRALSDMLSSWRGEKILETYQNILDKWGFYAIIVGWMFVNTTKYMIKRNVGM